MFLIPLASHTDIALTDDGRDPVAQAQKQPQSTHRWSTNTTCNPTQISVTALPLQGSEGDRGRGMGDGSEIG